MATRLAESDDAHAIAEIRIRGWQTAYRGLVADDYLDALSIEADIPAWSAVLSTQAQLRRTLVEIDGPHEDVIGFCSMGPYRTVDLDRGIEVVAVSEPETVGEIYAFYVHPDKWGGGFADSLMNASVDSLRRDGWTSALLWVLEANIRARRFYARHNWAPDGATQVLPISGRPVEVRLECAFRGTNAQQSPP